MTNWARFVVAFPSVTLIVILAKSPAEDGVPPSAPDDELNVAHAGFPVIWKVRVSPSASAAVG
jgi:hypothetical protein